MNKQLSFPGIPCIEESDEKPGRSGERRLKKPERMQGRFVFDCLDNRIPCDHKARSIWEYVRRLDLSQFLDDVQAVEHGPGRDAIDPKVLVAIWMLAISDGVIQGRTIAKLIRESAPYQWICGGIEMSYTVINSFRAAHSEKFNSLLSQSISVLMASGVITLDKLAQDGVKVKAGASRSLFHREPTIRRKQREVREYIRELDKEAQANPSAYSNAQKSARLREAKKREENIDKALEELEKLRSDLDTNRSKYRKKKLSDKEKAEIRASIVDPQARRMRMANSGFKLGYNVQLVVDCDSLAVVGMDVGQQGTDGGLIRPMVEQIQERTGGHISSYLVDSGYRSVEDTNFIHEQGIKLHMPLPQKMSEKSLLALQRKGEATQEWIKTMQTDEGKEAYTERCKIELVNAQLRNKGVGQLVVRGIRKVRGMISLMMLYHNFTRAQAYA